MKETGIEGGTPELLLSVEEWIAQIESTWRNIPEFKVDHRKLKHLAIICDGNRRAAQERRLQPYFGHQAGIETVKGIARACREWNIQTLTFWLWSTENWEREKAQVEFIMNLGRRYAKDEEFIQELCYNQVRFTHLGRKDRLPPDVRDGLGNWERQTADFERFRLNLAIDYGGEDEMVRAIVGIIREIQGGRLSGEEILGNPRLISEFLDTKTQPPPDLVIRTGTRRDEIPHTSGFMPLQASYAAWIFLPDLFPNLAPQILLKPIKEFLGYERRFGR
jgi:undecaprenyl diphosphate synthase